MKKEKVGEIVKVAAITILSVGLFSAAFIGANNLAFVAATSASTSFPLQAAAATSFPLRAAAVSAPASETPPPDGLKTPSLTVSETPGSARSATAISPNEAADLGARYILDMFGENIDGSKVEMFYGVSPWSVRTYCYGNVYPASEPDSGKLVYDFTLDAVSGERIGINNYRASRLGLPDVKERTMTFDEATALYNEPPANVDEYAQIARDYAQRHFDHTEVVSARFDHTGVMAYGTDKDSKTLTFKEKNYDFIVTDDTGREALVTITSETKQLLFLDTSSSDIVPGFNADQPGSVG